MNDKIIIGNFLEEVSSLVKIEGLITGSRSLTHSLIKLAEYPNLPENLIPRFLEVINELEDEYYCSRALVALVQNQTSKLELEFLPKILEIASKIYLSFYLDILKVLSPQLNEEMHLQVLDFLDQTTDIVHYRSYRSQSLTVLTPYLSPALQFRVLGTAARINERAFRELLQRLSTDSVPEAFRTVSEIKESRSRADALIALFPKLPSDLIPDALKVTSKIGEHVTFAKVWRKRENSRVDLQTRL